VHTATYYCIVHTATYYCIVHTATYYCRVHTAHSTTAGDVRNNARQY